MQHYDQQKDYEKDFNRQVGARLRATRHIFRMTLRHVEVSSGGKWKAVVVSAYERGDRSIKVVKLAALAEFYGVAMVDLLPRSKDTETRFERG